ncbi:MAG TPA: SURF1 family protein [Stellaceae bacterium]|jgi:surfeit locus 1 family protein|nr:SURF1 family protein [Stellaceae bacterium]
MPGLRPRPLPTASAAAIVLVCLGLGVWQIARLHWKEGLIAAREAALHAAPVPPPASLAAAQALEYRPIAVDGTFLNDKEIDLHAISPGGVQGYRILTPLRTAGGAVIFVDRGFVPSELRDPARRAAGQPAGTVHVTGILRLPPAGKPNWFLPDNNPGLNHWFWVDLPAMAAAAGLDRAAPFYLDADATPNPGGWPKGGAALPELPNNHLQYAITWFALAIAMVVIWIVYHRRG